MLEFLNQKKRERPDQFDTAGFGTQSVEAFTFGENAALNVEILIIGGGIIGSCIAHELCKYKVSVGLIEKETDLCFGVSKANSGIVHTGFQSDPGALKTRMAVRGNELYRELAEALDFPFLPVGELVVAFPGEESGLDIIRQTGEKLKIPGLKIVDRKWLDENEPNLSEEIICALLGPTAAVINPYETVYALGETAAANGVKIECEAEVGSLEKKGAHWEVTTPGEVHRAGYVINAAGLYADRIAAMAGVAVPRIHPWKGEEYLLDKHAHRLTGRVIFPLPRKETKGVLVIPTVDGNTMIGPTAEEIFDPEDVSTSGRGKQAVIESIRRLIPSFQEDMIIASFAGLRPTTVEGDFHIREDRQGLINLVGIQSPGITAAPAIAEHVVAMIREKKDLSLKNSYAPRRTSIPRFRLLDGAQRNSLIRKNRDFGEVVCRCEMVTGAEIKDAIRRGARTMDGVKFRTRSQMGRCHGSFCTMKIMNLLSQELDIPYEQITKRGKGSELIKV
ncbi:MAG: NAD(P)/FAD-dependent oxidoreductase [Deltaproteobacteria bacterium]|nr:NAD(P)/FAD-dependent oxidoreductase [Deltaproteobacteria bacterium]